MGSAKRSRIFSSKLAKRRERRQKTTSQTFRSVYRSDMYGDRSPERQLATRIVGQQTRHSASGQLAKVVEHVKETFSRT